MKEKKHFQKNLSNHKPCFNGLLNLFQNHYYMIFENYITSQKVANLILIKQLTGCFELYFLFPQFMDILLRLTVTKPVTHQITLILGIFLFCLLTFYTFLTSLGKKDFLLVFSSIELAFKSIWTLIVSSTSLLNGKFHQISKIIIVGTGLQSFAVFPIMMKKYGFTSNYPQSLSVGKHGYPRDKWKAALFGLKWSLAFALRFRQLILESREHCLFEKVLSLYSLKSFKTHFLDQVPNTFP